MQQYISKLAATCKKRTALPQWYLYLFLASFFGSGSLIFILTAVISVVNGPGLLDLVGFFVVFMTFSGTLLTFAALMLTMLLHFLLRGTPHMSEKLASILSLCIPIIAAGLLPDLLVGVDARLPLIAISPYVVLTVIPVIFIISAKNKHTFPEAAVQMAKVE